MTKGPYADRLLLFAMLFTCVVLVTTAPVVSVSVVNAEDQVKPAHPSTAPQVRLASWWFTRHAEKIAEIEAANDPKNKKTIELLMVGDSITNNFDKGGPGESVWKQKFVPLNALNLGFGGDRTNHVLWRLDHLPPLKTPPKAASLMIGTNNICWGSDQPKQAADGVQAIARKLNQMYPEMKILVLGVFPRRQTSDHPHRKQIIELNSYLPDLLNDIPNVTYKDIGQRFLDENGFLSKEMMPDTTHPSKKGHEIWANAIVPLLVEMMDK
jgi:beta-glucosidase